MEIVFDKNKFNPFLRWTGSKRWFVKEYLENYLPKDFNNYHEPFLGAGSVFFYLKSHDKSKRQYYLSDSNDELINSYMQLKNSPEDVIKTLSKFINSEEEYYKIRKYSPKLNEKRAARFIYLNRTSFNGIYRVNSNGKYNVPYGHRENVDIVNEDLLMDVHSKLKGVNLKVQNFEKSLKNIKKGDLVFLDPPYTVAHENNGFIEYNQHLFSWEDQKKLKSYIEEIIKKEAYFILTNASHKSLMKLYKDIGTISKLSRHSQVGGRNKTRGMYNEIIVSNTKL